MIEKKLKVGEVAAEENVDGITILKWRDKRDGTKKVATEIILRMGIINAYYHYKKKTGKSISLIGFRELASQTPFA